MKKKKEKKVKSWFDRIMVGVISIIIFTLFTVGYAKELFGYALIVEPQKSNDSSQEVVDFNDIINQKQEPPADVKRPYKPKGETVVIDTQPIASKDGAEDDDSDYTTATINITDAYYFTEVDGERVYTPIPNTEGHTVRIKKNSDTAKSNVTEDGKEIDVTLR